MKKTTKKSRSAIEPGDLVYVEWVDTAGEGGWHSMHDELVETITVRQAGFFLHRSKDTLHLTWGMPKGDSCQVMDQVAIPTGTIKSIRKIKL